MKKNLPNWNRRTLLQAMSAAPLLAAAPGIVRALNNSDVIVIGAGLSGLNAALALQDAGMNVRVLEGRNRAGGRVESLRNIPGSPEVGGTAFGPGYARLVDAAKTYGVELIDLTPTIPFFFQRTLMLEDKVITKEAWPQSPLNPFPAEAREAMPWMYLNLLLAKANPLKNTDSWVDPANAGLDISLYEWLRLNGQSDDIIRMAYNINPPFGNSAHDVSALLPLASDRFATLQRSLAAGSKVMGYTAKNGNQSIPDAMANALKNDVQYNTTVVGIRSTDTGAEVHCADGSVQRAKYVVCSLPTSVLKRVRVEPDFTGAQLLGVQTLESQVINQLHLIPRTQFWQQDGLSPSMFTDSLAGMVVAEHKGNAPADVTSLTVWIRGHAAAWMDQMDTKEAIAQVVADLERLRPAAKGQLEVGGYKSWYRDPFAAGDWAAWQPGQVSAFATSLAKPNGKIHFCGEHTAVSNRGMEGAMESGERVALEILQKG